MFGTDVWLNKEHLGGDISCYTSQEYDARDAVRPGTNELVVRVGQKADLPSHSAVGNDQERTDWVPGIWGDVILLQSGNPCAKLVQVIPHIGRATAEVRTTVHNYSSAACACEVVSAVFEKRSSKRAGGPVQASMTIAPGCSTVHVSDHRIAGMRMWSIDDPFLYEIETTILMKGSPVDILRTAFGMREFTIDGASFMFNGKPILLKGGNIAFHRFLSDGNRGTLPWNPDWIKEVLVDIPRAHNFNFIRNHIGQMYNRWYDIADEHGMLLQNEWMFWTTSGSKEQIHLEFTRWLRDNWNHPSIIIWDALNECSDDVVQKEIVPEMKRLDPTRPWESVDWIEEHPYIYSLGPVLNDAKFGFARSLDEIEASSTPTMLNEFCWWWLDKEFRPTSLMQEVVERWLGPHWTTEQLVAHQSFLVRELVELFRRMRVKAIQPFVYLSNDAGATGNWFTGNIADLQPKPILKTLQNAFAPFGISIELWDRHFFLDELRMVRIFVFNDDAPTKNGMVRYGIRTPDGDWLSQKQTPVSAPPQGCSILPVEFSFPPEERELRAVAELYEHNRLVAHSEKIVHTFRRISPPAGLARKKVGILGPSDELAEFLSSVRVDAASGGRLDVPECEVLIVGEGAAQAGFIQSHRKEMLGFLESGKTIIILEPELGVEGKALLKTGAGLDLTVEKRQDADRGGYDSYVFAEDPAHPLWNGISPEHLKLFNGGYGGEVISAHDVTPNMSAAVLARCGLKLKTAAVFQIPLERGRVIVSRLQLRGRLLSSSNSQKLFARRIDPVAQRYLMNLLAYASE